MRHSYLQAVGLAVRTVFNNGGSSLSNEEIGSQTVKTVEAAQRCDWERDAKSALERRAKYNRPW